MISPRMLSAISFWLIVVHFASRGQCDVIGVYDANRLVLARLANPASGVCGTSPATTPGSVSPDVLARPLAYLHHKLR